jgi:iron complex outermembrane recepter protein
MNAILLCVLCTLVGGAEPPALPAGASTVGPALQESGSLLPSAVPLAHVVTGTVIPADDSSQGLAGVEVILEWAGAAAEAPHRPRRSTLSDRSGAFAFSGVPQGEWTLSARAPGYATLERTLHVPLEAPLRLVLEPRPLELEEIIATASPTGSRVRVQPAHALELEEILRRMGVSVGSMLDGEPGVAMRSMGPAPARPVIRGFDGDRVVVLENGERMGDLSETAADHAISLDPLALTRVEVVRGPASLLYGSSALGGVVNLFTDDIPRSWRPGWSGDLSTQGASVNRSAAGGVRLGYGAADWKATGRASLRRAGDLRTPEARLHGTDLSSADAQLGLGWERGTLKGGTSLSLVGRSYGIPEALDDPAEEVEIRMARQALQSRLDWTPLGEGTVRGIELRLNAARFHQEELERQFVSAGAYREDLELEFDQLSVSTTATLRHASLGPVDEGAVGLSLRGRTLEVGGDEAFTPGVREASAAVFAFQEIPLADRVRVQAGLRGEIQRARTRANDAFPDSDEARRSSTLSGSMGLNVRPAEGWEVGAQLARAHRHPGLEELHARGPHLGAGVYEIGDPTLGDEVGHGIDIFVRRGSHRLALEVAAFTTWIDDFVAFEPTGRLDAGSGLEEFEYRAVDARMSGFEGLLTLRPVEPLRLAAGVDLVRGNRRDAARTPLPAIPPLRGRFEARWDNGGWWWGGTARAVAAQRRVAPGEASTDGYMLLDGEVGLRLAGGGGHTFVLRVENATNALYRDHLSRVEERGFPMPGRNLSLVYRWSF